MGIASTASSVTSILGGLPASRLTPWASGIGAALDGGEFFNGAFFKGEIADFSVIKFLKHSLHGVDDQSIESNAGELVNQAWTGFAKSMLRKNMLGMLLLGGMDFVDAANCALKGHFAEAGLELVEAFSAISGAKIPVSNLSQSTKSMAARETIKNLKSKKLTLSRDDYNKLRRTDYNQRLELYAENPTLKDKARQAVTNMSWAAKNVKDQFLSVSRLEHNFA